jgi:hypothetical protein
MAQSLNPTVLVEQFGCQIPQILMTQLNFRHSDAVEHVMCTRSDPDAQSSFKKIFFFFYFFQFHLFIYFLFFIIYYFLTCKIHSPHPYPDA